MSKLFSSLKIRNIELKNRIVVSPMCQYSSIDGNPTDWHLVHLGSRAVGGAGLIFTEATAVSPEGRISPDDAGIWNDTQVNSYRRITSFIKSQKSIPGIQLAHAGRKASTFTPWKGNGKVEIENGGWQTLAPSAIPFAENYPDPKEIVVQRFRIKVQGYMIRSVVDAFIKNHTELMAGSFKKDILLESSAGNVRRALKELAKKHIFTDKNIITIELVGDEVIKGLLHLFVDAVLSEERKERGSRCHKLYNLISSNYVYLCENHPYKKTNGEPSVYDRLLLVTDFICGMTDSYAIDLYRKLKGVKL